MRNPRSRGAVAQLLLLVLISFPAYAAGRATATRTGHAAPRSAGAGHARAVRTSQPTTGRTSPGTATRTAPGTATRPGHVPHQALGRATYGYYGPYDYYYYPGWWWGSSWGWGWGWDYGWPYYSFGMWWYPESYYEPVSVYATWNADVPALVETAIRPRDASVQLDGEAVGFAKDYSGTWDELRVGAGNHILEFSAPGYLTLRVQLTARAGGTYRIDEDLRKGEGMDPRSGAIGEPSSAPSAMGPHTAPTGAAETSPDASANAAALRRGLLRIVASPPDAAVYLDGEFLATAGELSRLHGAIPVAEGPHHIEAVRPGYPARSVDVNVSSAGPAKVHLDLVEGRDAEVD